MRAQLAETKRPDQVDPAHYDAILYAGGHGTMWDCPGNEALATLGRDVYVDGRLVTGQNPAAARGVGEAVVKVLDSLGPG
jgi:putative intracellular protease/amidase